MTGEKLIYLGKAMLLVGGLGLTFLFLIVYFPEVFVVLLMLGFFAVLIWIAATEMEALDRRKKQDAEYRKKYKNTTTF